MWNLSLSDEQALIARSAREYLARELPLERLRPKAAARDLAQVRGGMAKLGWFGLGVPENAGGAGLGVVEELLLQRECGRFLVSPSMLATVLGAHVAVCAGDTSFAHALVHGEIAVALAIVTTVEASLDRAPIYALDWNASEPLLVWNAHGIGVFAPESFSDVQPHAGLDDSVAMHAGVLVGPPRCWVAASQAPLVTQAQVLLAARLIGLAEHVTEIAVEYAKTRVQFGKPIGSFQAVKHRCADMTLRAQLGWCQIVMAGQKVQAGSRDSVLQAAAAKLIAAHAAHENGRAAIQLHGGMGFQSECDAHWFMKRAHIYDQAGGCMRTQARRVIAEPSPLW